MSPHSTVSVAVTNLWGRPGAVRPVDAAMLADQPDLDAWLGAMDSAARPDQGRLGLHDRLLTQLAHGEPVHVHAAAQQATGGWQQVSCPWQPAAGGPSGGGAEGYRGWVVAAHLRGDGEPGLDAEPSGTDPAGTDATGTDPSGTDQPDRQAGSVALLDAARTYLGVPYLWGGCCAEAVDCAGLVHLAARAVGLLAPRDAADQYDACQPVPVARAGPGDLLFFARHGSRPHHVGIVAAPGRMLHAPETGAVVVEEALGEELMATLVAAGRLVRRQPGGAECSAVGSVPARPKG